MSETSNQEVTRKEDPEIVVLNDEEALRFVPSL